MPTRFFTRSSRDWVSHDTYTGFIYTDLFTSLNEKGGDTAPEGSYEDGKSGYSYAFGFRGILEVICSTFDPSCHLASALVGNTNPPDSESPIQMLSPVMNIPPNR